MTRRRAAEKKEMTAELKELLAPADNHLREDDVFSSRATEATAEEIFGENPEKLTDSDLDGLVGSKDVVVHTIDREGAESQQTGEQLREAVKTGERKLSRAEEPAEAEPAAEKGPEEKAEAAEGAKEPEKKEPRSDRRYRTMEAQLAEARAKVRALEVTSEREVVPAVPKVDYDKMPKSEDFEDDESHREATRKWVDEQVKSRETKYLAEMRAHRTRARETSAMESEKARAQTLADACADEVGRRWSKDEIAAKAAENAKVKSNFKRGTGGDPLPMVSYLIGRRGDVDAAGALGDDAMSAPQLMAEIFDDPDKVEAFENATEDSVVLSAMAAVDNPIPLALHFRTDEGRKEVAKLEALAKGPNASMVMSRVAAMAGGAGLSGGSGRGGDADRVVTQHVSETPRPASSPRAGVAAGSSGSPRPSMGGENKVDPAFLEWAEAELLNG